MFALIWGLLPIGLAIHLNSAMGWLVFSCAMLVVFALFCTHGSVVDDMPDRLNQYFEARAGIEAREKEAAKQRLQELERDHRMMAHWVVLDAKVERDIALTPDEQAAHRAGMALIAECAGHLRDWPRWEDD